MTIENPDVQKLMSDLGLTLIKPFRIADGGFVRSFVLLCEDKKGDKKVLKIFASKDEGARKRFVKEIEILKFLHKNPQTVGYAIVIRKYGETQFGGVPDGTPHGDSPCLAGRQAGVTSKVTELSPVFLSPYYLMDFVEGQDFGEFTQDLGFKMGIFKKPAFKKFLRFWVGINSLNMSHLRNVPNLNSYGYHRAVGEWHYYKQHTLNILSSEQWLEVEEYLLAREDTLNDTKYLAHHDLYPGNLFISKPFSLNIKVIDWEQAHLTSFGCNEAFLYLMFWKEEYFRRKVYAKCRDMKGDDWESFKAHVLVLSVRFLYQIETFVDKSLDNYENFKNFLLYTINDVTSGNFDQPKNLQFLITREQISTILKDIYEIKSDFIYEDFAPGFSNTMLRIKTMTTDGEKKDLVLRIYKYDKEYQSIQDEVRAYNRLASRGVPTYILENNIKGDFISNTSIYGLNRYFILTHFLEGKVISRVTLNRAKVLSAGKALNIVHSRGVVHNDFNRRNLLYKGNHVSAVLDLEFASFTESPELKLADLAKAIALWLMGIDENASLNPPQVYEYFLEGYFGKGWEAKREVSYGTSGNVRELVIKAFEGLKRDYQEMQESSPSSYFENNIKHIENMVGWLSRHSGKPAEG